eukprot:SM000904S24464  [mRNA]  locus=s904:505:2235:- [translate_table: standard]
MAGGRACVQRLQKELKALHKEPVPQVVARPLPSDILEWHFVLEGSRGTPFEVHPETWNPMWSIASILTGLLSFMMDNTPTTGSVTTTTAEKQSLAQQSLAFNCKRRVMSCCPFSCQGVGAQGILALLLFAFCVAIDLMD